MGTIKDRSGRDLKETDENNRMGRTIDVFKKIRDTKGKSFRMGN